MAGSRRRVRSVSVARSIARYAPARVLFPVHEIVSRIGRPIRSVRPGMLSRVRPRPLVQRAVVRPRVGVVIGAPKKRRVLLGLAEADPKRLKIKKLCKCTHDRSTAQRKNSRRFYAGYGSRGTARKSEHACTCP